MLKLKIPPDQAGYSFEHGDTVVESKLDGGLPRTRMDIVGAAGAVDVSWTTDQAGFDYLQAFYALTGKKGLPFLADLIVDSATTLTEHECKWIGKPKLSGVAGLTLRVTGNFWVNGEVDETAAATIVEAYTP